jgi:CheY-like chemotaxis protein
MLILVVEDDPAQQRMYEAFFDELGHRVIAVSTAMAAVDALVSEKIDLVVLDYELDGTMTGVEVARFVAALRKSDHRKREVLMVSGHSLEEIKHRAFGDQSEPLSGVSFYFPKPIDSDYFLRVVESIAKNADEDPQA